MFSCFGDSFLVVITFFSVLRHYSWLVPFRLTTLFADWAPKTFNTFSFISILFYLFLFVIYSTNFKNVPCKIFLWFPCSVSSIWTLPLAKVALWIIFSHFWPLLLRVMIMRNCIKMSPFIKTRTTCQDLFVQIHDTYGRINHYQTLQARCQHMAIDKLVSYHMTPFHLYLPFITKTLNKILCSSFDL